MHYRQRIRDAVAQRLLDAATLAGANVFTSRARPVLEILQKREAVLSVYTADESSTRQPDGRLMDRTLTVSIEGMAGGGDDLDDYLDDLASQVEAAIEADPTLGNLLSDDMVLDATTSEITARGNQQVGAFRMDYSCRYLTERATPSDDALWPERPLPTQVNTTPVPTPQAYVWGTVGVETEPPAIIPPTIERDVVAPSVGLETAPTPCEGGQCAIPAWTGDKT